MGLQLPIMHTWIYYLLFLIFTSSISWCVIAKTAWIINNPHKQHLSVIDFYWCSLDNIQYTYLDTLSFFLILISSIILCVIATSVWIVNNLHKQHLSLIESYWCSLSFNCWSYHICSRIHHPKTIPRRWQSSEIRSP